MHKLPTKDELMCDHTRTCMQSYVNFETALGGEHLIAHLTLELLQTHVSLHMRRQRALDSE